MGKSEDTKAKRISSYEKAGYGSHPSKSSEIIKKIEETCLRKYGHKNASQSEAIKEKIIETNILKYGKAHYTQTEEYITKTKETNLKKYGATHHLKTEEGRAKQKSTNLERYGAEYLMQVDQFKEKSKQTCASNWGVENYAQSETSIENCKARREEEIRKKFTEINPSKELIIYARRFENGKLKCISCGHEYELKVSLSILGTNRENSIKCPNCETKSTQEGDVRKYLEEVTQELCPKTKKVLVNKELDIYSDKLKFAIEYNGLMFHSEGLSEYTKFSLNRIHPNYHLDKTKGCEDVGVHLFHIFENEWIDPVKQNIWKSMISNKANKSKKIYGRLCELSEISREEANEFFKNNHLQGTTKASIYVGLKHDDKLVSCMSFGKSRFNINYEYELIRFCSAIGTSVLGGASKMLRYFEKTHKPKSLISYANRRWSRGGLYESLGFENKGESQPNYFYFKPRIKILYESNNAKSLLNTYDSNLTEKENMFNNGYRIIYDSGNKIYTKTYN